MDVTSANEKAEVFRKAAGMEKLLAISAVTGSGVKTLLSEIISLFKKIS